MSTNFYPLRFVTEGLSFPPLPIVGNCSRRFFSKLISSPVVAKCFTSVRDMIHNMIIMPGFVH